MVLCGEKIVDGRKAESKIPVPDYYEGELFMTVISNMRSLNNDRVKRLRVDVKVVALTLADRTRPSPYFHSVNGFAVPSAVRAWKLFIV